MDYIHLQEHFLMALIQDCEMVNSWVHRALHYAHLARIKASQVAAKISPRPEGTEPYLTRDNGNMSQDVRAAKLGFALVSRHKEETLTHECDSHTLSQLTFLSPVCVLILSLVAYDKHELYGAMKCYHCWKQYHGIAFTPSELVWRREMTGSKIIALVVCGCWMTCLNSNDVNSLELVPSQNVIPVWQNTLQKVNFGLLVNTTVLQSGKPFLSWPWLYDLTMHTWIRNVCSVVQSSYEL